MQLSTLNFGIFLAYWIDYGFTQSYTSSSAWRVPCILQCIFLVPMLFILFIVPESPRWLASHAPPNDSLHVLQRLHKHHSSTQHIENLHADILRTCEFEASLGAGKWSDLLRNDSIQSQRRFLIACAIQSFQQLGGINALIYYSNTLFSTSLHFSDHLSALMSGFLQTWFFVASFIPWLLIDRVGRRPLLLSMISVMAAVMIVQTGLIYNVQNKTSIASSCGIGAAVMLFLFEGAFTIGYVSCRHVHYRFPSLLDHLANTYKLPSNGMGLPLRNPPPASPPTRILRLHSLQLDLQLHDRANHAHRTEQHRIQDVHHFRGPECVLGADHLFILSRDQGSGVGGC
jgi:hypothetical protein